MITYTELKAGLETVNNGGVIKISHHALGSGAIIRIKNEIVVGVGSLFVYCDDLRLRDGFLEFMKDGEVVTRLSGCSISEVE